MGKNQFTIYNLKISIIFACHSKKLKMKSLFVKPLLVFFIWSQGSFINGQLFLLNPNRLFQDYNGFGFGFGVGNPGADIPVGNPGTNMPIGNPGTNMPIGNPATNRPPGNPGSGINIRPPNINVPNPANNMNWNW